MVCLAEPRSGLRTESDPNQSFREEEKSGTGQTPLEQKIGIRNASFSRVNVGNRDLKRKGEEHGHFADDRGSTPPFPLLEVRP